MANTPSMACRKCFGAFLPTQLVRGYCPDCLKAYAPPANPLSNYSGKEHKPLQNLYYTARWTKQVRPAVLRKDILCRVCKRNPSTLVDHIVPHRGNLVLFWDFNNLQGMCDECHNVKTQREMAERRSGQKY